jgi:SAM-dependent methyltransferase
MNRSEFETMARVEETHPWFVNRRRLIHRLARRFMPVLQRPRVLDAGSGTGVNLTEYAELGWCAGVELDREAAQVSLARGNQRVAVGDLTRLPFRSGSFDLVISTDVLEHIENDVAALTEMSRVLTPHGRILLTTPAYSWAYSSHDRHLHHVRRYDRRRLLAAFRLAQLRVLHMARYNVLLAGPLLVLRRLRGETAGSDVGRPLGRLASAALRLIWRLEAGLAERIDLGLGLTHLAVLEHANRDRPQAKCLADRAGD